MIPLTRALARKRQALVARSREQRADVLLAAQPTVHGLGMLDRTAAFVRERPFAVALAVVALVAFGPRKVVIWGLRVMPIVSPILALLRRR